MNYPSNIIETVKDYVIEKHEGQKRKSTSWVNGKRHLYSKTHLPEVRRRFLFMGQQVIRTEPKLKSDIDLTRGQIIALMHDVYEDCYPEGSDLNRLVEITTKDLVEMGVSQFQAEYIANEVIYLTKNTQEQDKEKRNGNMYKAIALRPLETKLVKAADQSHNGGSLLSLPFAKAVRTYLKIRKSWPVMFNQDEIQLLYSAGLLESNRIMEERTAIFDLLSDGIHNKTELAEHILIPHPDPSQEPISPFGLFQQQINRINAGVFGTHIHTNSLLDNSEERLVQLCNEYPTAIPFIPSSTERQLRINHRSTGLQAIHVLRKVTSWPKPIFEQVIRRTIEHDERVCKGQTDFMLTDETREFFCTFLHILKITINEIKDLSQEEIQQRAQEKVQEIMSSLTAA